MPASSTVIALGAACVLWLGGCDKTPTASPTPIVDKPAPNEYDAGAGSAANPSVPSAESVFPAASATKADPAPGRSTSAMSATQESTAMPMPGQNNDHSAPIGPGRRASSP